jgi:hypothetical protein
VSRPLHLKDFLSPEPSPLRMELMLRKTPVDPAPGPSRGPGCSTDWSVAKPIFIFFYAL